MAPSLSKTTGVGTGTRLSIAIFISIALGLFMLLWDGDYIRAGLPSWLGSAIFLPLLATLFGFCGNILIQMLSCGKVKWSTQAIQAAFIPIPFWFTATLLFFIPGLRWPIEGLVQSTSPSVRHGISSGFYFFWTGLYTESIMIGLSQLC